MKVCNRCNSPVIKSDLPEYSYQCLNCDEDLYGFEVHNNTKLKPMAIFKHIQTLKYRKEMINYLREIRILKN